MAQLGALDPNAEINNGGGGSFTLLPDENYQLEVVESDVKANSKGTGQNLELKVQVASEGPYKGVHFFHSITSIQHSSAQAQAIGQGQLRALCEATGVDFTTLGDSEQLHYKPFWAQVGHESYHSNKHGRELTKNTIVKFLWEGMPEDATPSAPQPPASKAPPAQPAAAPASSAPRRPWTPK